MILYGHADDGYVANQAGGVTSWATIRGDASTSGTSSNDSSTYSTTGVYSIRAAGRSGPIYFNNRSYFSFRTTRLTGIKFSGISGATMNLYLDNTGSGVNAANVTLVIATSLAGSTADYGNVFSSGSTLGTVISGPIAVSTTAGYHSFVLNAASVREFNRVLSSGDDYVVGLMSFYHDYSNTAPTTGGVFTRIWTAYSEYTSTTRDPYIDLALQTDGIGLGVNF